MSKEKSNPAPAGQTNPTSPENPATPVKKSPRGPKPGGEKGGLETRRGVIAAGGIGAVALGLAVALLLTGLGRASFDAGLSLPQDTSRSYDYDWDISIPDILPGTDASLPQETMPVTGKGLPQLTLMNGMEQLAGFEYEYASEFYGGYAYAIKDGRCGYLDTDGMFYSLYDVPGEDFVKRLQDLHFASPDRFELTVDERGVAPYYDKAAGLWGYAHVLTGEIVMQPQYEAAYPYRYGMAVVKDEAGRHIIDEFGAVVYSGQVSENYFRSGVITAARGGKFYIVDKTGEELYAYPQADAAWQTTTATVFEDRVSIVQGFAAGDSPDHLLICATDGPSVVYHVLDGEGQRLFNSAEARPGGEAIAWMGVYRDGYMPVALDADFTTIGLVNGAFELAAKANVQQTTGLAMVLGEKGIGHMGGGLLMVTGKDEEGVTRCCYLDESLSVVQPAKYINGTPFEEGFAAVQDEQGVWGVIDESGFETAFFNWEFVGGFTGPVAVAKRMEDSKYCYIDPWGSLYCDEAIDYPCTPEEGFILVGAEDTTGKLWYGFLTAPEKPAE